VLGEDSYNPNCSQPPFSKGPEGTLLGFWKQIRNEGNQLEEFHLKTVCSRPAQRGTVYKKAKQTNKQKTVTTKH